MITTPLGAELAQRVAAADERVELLYEPALLPPARWTGDTIGDPGHRRDADGERRWEALLAQAEVAYGIPGSSGEGLAGVARRAPRLRWVQARNAGAGEQLAAAAGIDADAVRRVRVTTSSGVHAGPLAEFCLLGLLAFAKRLPALLADQRARRWPTDLEPFGELRGRTLLVVGLGAIGSETARLAQAFGMRVLGVRRDPAGSVPGVDEIHAAGELPALAARADAIVVTLPLTDATRGLVSRDVLSAVRPGTVFVNVGRGGVVDEAALIERLQDGTLAGAALDVFAQEPLPPESPLWGLCNVIVSPHAVALVPAEEERIIELFCDNLRRFAAGEALINQVDPEVLY